MSEPAFIPQYNRPDAPGIWMNFDNTVSVYHVVGPDDTFEQASLEVMGMIRDAQQRFPAWPRVLYLDILGHRLKDGRFDTDFFEFQQEFLFGVIGPFVTAFDAPLTGPMLNPALQRNDVPDRLNIAPPVAGV